jgi:hypothetical protein
VWTLGVPLGRWIIDEEHGGLFRTLFGTHTGTMGYGAPILVILATTVIIAILAIPSAGPDLTPVQSATAP